MRSLKEWRKVSGLNENEAPDEDVMWKNLKMVFGETRQMAKPELIQAIKGKPLNEKNLEEMVQTEYQGNKDAMAKDLITALLKMIYQGGSGGGMSVSGDEMQRQQNSTQNPLGDSTGDASGGAMTQQPNG